MNILVGKFVLEANAYVPMKCDMENIALSYGKKALEHMQLGNVFADKDIKVIPVICADAACSGVMKEAAFTYIEKRIIDSIKTNLKDLDGIYLHLHGASYVENIGSGEHHILREIRKIVGPYMPIAVSCDPHGNLTKEYVENTNFIRSYRESPHTDIEETVSVVCKNLIDIIKKHKKIKPVYRKLPLILGGEQSVSADEPVNSINKYMDELEKQKEILSASWHVGYIRHDCPEAGCGIVVIPSEEKYQAYAEKVADDLAAFVFERRHEFHYTGLTERPEVALKKALDFPEKPVFITDSGDNVTSGAMGANTFVLRQFLEVNNLQKKVLFASINDPQTYNYLAKKNLNEELMISLGMDKDSLTKKVALKVMIKYKGFQEGTHMYGESGNYGGLVTVQVKNSPITIVITANNHSFVEEHQIKACGVNIYDFDIIVVKQGYIHPELKEIGKMNIMSLTDGATPQNISLIPLKRIMRPMYPIDKI